MSQDGPNLMNLRAADVYPKLDTLISSFAGESPEYIHSEATVSSLWRLSNNNNPEPYLEEAPPGYIEAVAAMFPVVVGEDYPHKITVVTQLSGRENQLDLTAAVEVIAIWAQQTLDQLSNDILAGCIKISISDPNNFNTSEVDLVSVKH